jgi:hypothetical protein
MRQFDSIDYEVVKAHGIASGSSDEGLAPEWMIRRYHPGPLPTQRLTGMARRGLMHFDRGAGEWRMTAEGVRLAHAFRDRASAGHDR